MKREGFKLPEGWKWVKLGEVVDLEVGIRPKGGATEEGIPSLGGEHITEDGKIVFNDKNAKFIPEDFYKIMRKGKVKELDILINKDGANTGKVGILKNLFTKRVAINEHVFILRAKDNLEQRFLFYWLFSHLGQTKIKEIITGSAQPGLSASFVNFLFLPTPPLPEQQKIAEILETVDNAIEKTEKIIEKYKRIKQGLMQELLTKGIDKNWQIRSEETHKFKDSPLGRIPAEWEVVSVFDIAHIVSGGTPNTSIPEYWNGNIPWLSIEDFNTGNRWVFSSSKFITELGLKRSNTKVLRRGMLLISARGTVGAIVQLGKDMAFNQSCYGLDSKNKDKLSNDFLYYALIYYIKFFLSLTYGNVFDTITKDNFKEIRIPLPPLPGQRRIVKVLSQIDEVIEKEENYKRKLESLKRGLMEDLLTGKVRVNNLLEEI